MGKTLNITVSAFPGAFNELRETTDQDTSAVLCPGDDPDGAEDFSFRACRAAQVRYITAMTDTQYVVETPERPSLPVAGQSARYPVRRVYCVGWNYTEHVREMKGDERNPPIFFLKAADNVMAPGGKLPYPPKTTEMHHEIELVAAIGKAGRDIAPEDALDHVWGYAVGLDMTRRDLQWEAKAKGAPWDTGKTFDCAAPISAVHPVSETGHPSDARIWLAVDGETRQSSSLDKMVWPVADIISHLSGFFTLVPGDLIFTGTPEGVGPVSQGQVLTGGVDGVAELSVEIV